MVLTSGAFGNEMARLPVVGAQVVLCAAAAFILVERASGAPAPIDLHRAGVLAGGWVLGWGEGLAAGVWVLLPRLLLRLSLMLVLRRVSGLSCSDARLRSDAGPHVRLEIGRHLTLARHLKPDKRLKLPREHIDRS